ncbi:hypothetical protein [Novosphingobium sp.]|uniref:hypothetical protein n=1 Tax=Novosphingobium sp. TaxID=1874826 RepID=UPI0025E2A6C2|nr:hypothetical protein [Novosphingobium sp.]MCC6927100.1 hypothetical protein [Novosphingobium sp.]
MATQNPAIRSRSPFRRRVLTLGLVLLAALLAWFWGPLNAYARTGAAYGARVACSCRFLGGRELGDCKKDFEPGMELVMLSEDAQAKSVTARFPGLASQTASYRPGLGCQLEPWQG